MRGRPPKRIGTSFTGLRKIGRRTGARANSSDYSPDLAEANVRDNRYELAFRHPLRLDLRGDQGRRHRARQQDRQNGLGHDGQGRTLQGTRRACGVNEIAPDIRRDGKVGRANST